MSGSDPRPVAAEEGDDLLGEVIGGRYRLQRVLGRGGMGRVYLGEHVELGRQVAVKVIADARTVPQALERFVREARALGKIRHENVVDVIDHGNAEGVGLYLVMEHLEGEDLQVFIAREGRISFGRARAIVLQILRGLAAAHRVGVMHRDIKPENCFLVARDDGLDYVKVLDFGLAKPLEPRMGERITLIGSIFGTAEYMAPERASGDTVDERADIYSVGAILYELVTGRVMYECDSFAEVLHRQINTPVTPPSELVPPVDLPPGAEQAILHALAKPRLERPQTCDAMIAELCAIAPTIDPGAPFQLLDARPEASAPTAALGVSRDDLRREGPPLDLIAAAIVVFVLAVGGIAWSILGTREDPRPAVATIEQPSRPIAAPAPSTAPPERPPPAPVAVPSAEATVEPTPEPTPETTPTGSTPTKAPPTQAKDGLDPARVAAAFRGVAPLVAACKGGLVGGRAGQRVTVEVQVSPTSGKPTRVRVVGKDAGTPVGACVVDAVLHARFGPFDGAARSIRRTLTL